MDEVSERIGDLTRGVKTLAKNQDTMISDLGELKISLAVHVEKETAFEERLASLENPPKSPRVDFSLTRIIGYPVFWVVISIMAGIVAIIFGLPVPY